MGLTKLLQLLSLGFLLYLLGDTFMHIDFAVSKNNALNTWRKVEVDSIQNIDTVKQKAKETFDTIRSIHRNYSELLIRNFWLLIGLLILQVFLIFSKQTKSSATNKGR